MLNNYAVTKYFIFVIDTSLRLVLKSVTFILVTVDVRESRVAWYIPVSPRLHRNTLSGTGTNANEC